MTNVYIAIIAFKKLIIRINLSLSISRETIADDRGSLRQFVSRDHGYSAAIVKAGWYLGVRCEGRDEKTVTI